MNQELERVENKNADQGLTELVGSHPAKSSGFVAFCNSPFDGDNFPTDVAETGASAALVSDPPRAIKSPSPLSLLQVQGNLSTLHKFAPSYRQLMPLGPNNFPTDVAETGASAALVSDPLRAMKSPSALSLLQVQSPSPLSLLQVQGSPTMLRKIAPSYRPLMPLRPVWN